MEMYSFLLFYQTCNFHAIYFSSSNRDDRLKLSFSSLLLEDVQEDDETKIAILFTTLRIIDAYCQLYDEYSATKAFWLPIERLLNLLPVCSLEF